MAKTKLPANSRANKKRSSGAKKATRGVLRSVSRTKKTKSRKTVRKIAIASARLIQKRKRIFNQSQEFLKERLNFDYSKGKKKSLNQETAKEVFQKTRSKFSRSSTRARGVHYVVRIKYRYLDRSKSWRTRSVYFSSKNLDSAIDALIHDSEISSQAYEGEDKDGNPKEFKIQNAEKKLIGVSYDKLYKKPKTVKGSRKKKKTRRFRHRK